MRNAAALTGQTTNLTSVSGGSLTDAQVSTDGQYVLFISGRKLQMIRINGQGLQTLYCYPQSTGVPGGLANLLWSPKHKNTTEVAPIVGNLWDMDVTPDSRTLILSQCGAERGQQRKSRPHLRL
jgi:hypothetical protein